MENINHRGHEPLVLQIGRNIGLRKVKGTPMSGSRHWTFIDPICKFVDPFTVIYSRYTCSQDGSALNKDLFAQRIGNPSSITVTRGSTIAAPNPRHATRACLKVAGLPTPRPDGPSLLQKHGRTNLYSRTLAFQSVFSAKRADFSGGLGFISWQLRVLLSSRCGRNFLITDESVLTEAAQTAGLDSWWQLRIWGLRDRCQRVPRKLGFTHGLIWVVNDDYVVEKSEEWLKLH